MFIGIVACDSSVFTVYLYVVLNNIKSNNSLKQKATQSKNVASRSNVLNFSLIVTEELISRIFHS